MKMKTDKNRPIQYLSERSRNRGHIIMNMEEVDEFLDYFQEKKHFPDWHGSKKKTLFCSYR